MAPRLRLKTHDPAHGGLHWLAFCALLGAGSLLAWGVPSQALEWQPALAWAQPWRWWTAAWVHYSAQHLGANLGACAVVGAYGYAARLPARWAWAWVAAWPLTHGLLLAMPGLARYGGLSGVLHGGVTIACLGLLWHERGRRQAIGAAVLLGMFVKFWLERPWAGPVQHWPEWDIGIAPIAHVTGALAGALAGCAMLAARHSQRGDPP